MNCGLLVFRGQKGYILMAKLKKPKTHFAQVPLKIVKRIAVIETPGDGTNGAGVTVKPPAKGKPHTRASGPPD